MRRLRNNSLIEAGYVDGSAPTATGFMREGRIRALAATGDTELVVLPAFTGGPEQLWRMDRLADGAWRITPKSIPNSKEMLVLSAVGASSATLAKFDPGSEKQRWLFKTP